MTKVAVAQTGSVLFDTPSTVKNVETYCRSAVLSSAKLLVFPEALLGGYPKGMTFGATVGNRTDQGREHFRRYSQAAIRCPSPETETLSTWANELNLHIVIGVAEREGASLGIFHHSY
jgi:nitrilase